MLLTSSELGTRHSVEVKSLDPGIQQPRCYCLPALGRVLHLAWTQFSHLGKGHDENLPQIAEQQLNKMMPVMGAGILAHILCVVNHQETWSLYIYIFLVKPSFL